MMSCFGFCLQTLREHKTSVRRLVKIATRSLTELPTSSTSHHLCHAYPFRTRVNALGGTRFVNLTSMDGSDVSSRAV